MGIFGEKCVVCQKNKTKRKDEYGSPICVFCELEKRAEREEKRRCPVDGATMTKEIIEDSEIIIDRCPKCRGVWLDGDELKQLIEDAEDNSYVPIPIIIPT